MSETRSFEFSVLTCNLRFGLANDGPNSWPFRKKAFASFFKRHISDFICFQEANDFQISFLQSHLPHHQYIGRRIPAPSFWQNNVIFFRNDWNCTRSHHFYLSPTPEIPSRMRLSRWPRQCTIGMFERDARRIICANTHFDFDSQVQNVSARIILQRINQFSIDIPAILAGDFNTTPVSVCHRILTGLSAESEGPRPDHFANVFQAPYPATYHDWTGKTDGDCIDWILHRGQIRPQDVRIVSDTFCGYYLSDHFPVRATFIDFQVDSQQPDL